MSESLASLNVWDPKYRPNVLRGKSKLGVYVGVFSSVGGGGGDIVNGGILNQCGGGGGG